MLVHKLGDADLGAHAVGAGDQHRLLHPGEVGDKQAAEAADVGDHAGNEGALDVGAHQLHTLVASLNIHTGVPVAVRKTTHLPLSPFH